MVGQSPPTTSGLVIISGSNNFGVDSDFPVAIMTLDLDVLDVLDMPLNDVLSPPPSFGNLGMIDHTFEIETFDAMVMNDVTSPPPSFGNLEMVESVHVQDVPFFSFAPSDDNIKITSTNVTTSGVVVIDLFPGAGEGTIPFVPPAFLNQRIFPVTFSGLGERLFPEENRRIYPVLPQFSVITPGD
jgi:hypothetical protein